MTTSVTAPPTTSASRPTTTGRTQAGFGAGNPSATSPSRTAENAWSMRSGARSSDRVGAGRVATGNDGANGSAATSSAATFATITSRHRVPHRTLEVLLGSRCPLPMIAREPVGVRPPRRPARRRSAVRMFMFFASATLDDLVERGRNGVDRAPAPLHGGRLGILRHDREEDRRPVVAGERHGAA